MLNTGTAHTQAVLSELRSEENLVARVGVVGGAGLVGLVVGAVRGRWVVMD